MKRSRIISSQRVMTGGAVVAPLLLVLAIRGLLGGPVAAPAALSSQMPSFGAVAPASPTSEKEFKALAWTREHATIKSGASPMDHAELPPPPEPTFVVDPVAPAKPVADPLEGLAVTSILGHDATGFVAAMGKLFRFGDEIVPGWKITAIDARMRHIDVMNGNGETRRLSLKQ